MISVHFNSELQRTTGEACITLHAENYRDMVNKLVDRYGFEREFLMEMAVSINGLIIHDPLLEVIEENSDVHFLHRIAGG